MIKKLMSLGLCICFALVVGVVSKPIEVKAAEIIDISFGILDRSLVLIDYKSSEPFSYVGLNGGTVFIYDDAGNSYSFDWDIKINAQSSSGNFGRGVQGYVYDPARTYYVVIPNGFFFYTNTQGEIPGGVTAVDYMQEITCGERPEWLDDSPVPLESISTGDDYYDRHYNYWITVYNQLIALPNNGKLTVDASGNNLDHVQHFVFDALNGTNRTLTFIFADGTYVISGRNMKTIALGHNHTFELLTSLGYRTEQL